MSAAATLIPVTRKAPNVCGYCRTRKQACNRTVPSCSRCIAKGQNCDYTPSPPQPTNITEPLVLQAGTFAPHLSSQGAWELVQLVDACLNPASSPAFARWLANFTADILSLANVDFPTVLDHFDTSVQQWCPIFPENVLHHGAETLILDHPMLSLGIWFVTKTARGHPEHYYGCQLYQALKQVHALLQTASDVRMETLQLGMLIAVFEMGHGMGRQAFQTLGGCKCTLTMLELDAQDRAQSRVLDNIRWLKVSLLTLDCTLLIVTPVISLPPTFPPADSICTNMAANSLPPIPAHFPNPTPTSHRKVHLRSIVALASAPALSYIHALQRALEPIAAYDDIDTRLSDCITTLVDKPKPQTRLHCDGIALAFCSHMMLQQAQVQYLCKVSCADEQVEKARLALGCSRRMAWDMVKEATSKIEGEEEMQRLPFGGLCCVLRAGVAVLETSGRMADDVVTRGDVEGFERVVGWFSGRWGVGRQFETRIRGLKEVIV